MNSASPGGDGAARAVTLPRTRSPRPGTLLALIFVVALAARLAAAVALGLPFGGRPAELDGLRAISGAADEISYGTLAERLSTGHGLTFPRDWYPWIHADAPQTYFSTTTAVLFASVYAVTGVHPFAARILTVTLGALTVVALYALARRLFGRRVAVTAAVIAALYAYLVFYATRLVTETPFTLAVLCAVLVAYAARERPSTKLAVVLGLALGAAVLFRLAILFYVPVLLGWVWVSARRLESKAWLKWLALPTLIVGLMLAPLTVRNYRLWGRLVLSETQFGHVFWNGNHPDHQGSFHPFEVFPIPPEVLAIGNEAVMTSDLLKRGIVNVAADPLTFVNLTGDRLIEMYRFWPSRSSTSLANAMRLLSFGWVFPLALAGMWLSRRRWRDLIPIYTLIVVHTAVYAISWSMIRYRVPLDPYFIMFAAVAIVAIWNRARRHSPEAYHFTYDSPHQRGV